MLNSKYISKSISCGSFDWLYNRLIGLVGRMGSVSITTLCSCRHRVRELIIQSYAIFDCAIEHPIIFRSYFQLDTKSHLIAVSPPKSLRNILQYYGDFVKDYISQLPSQSVCSQLCRMRPGARMMTEILHHQITLSPWFYINFMK